MSLPNYEQFMKPVLEIFSLSANNKVSNILNDIVIKCHLTKEQQEEILPSGIETVLHNRVSWATYYMFRAGLLDRVSRGVYKITETGKLLLKNNTDINVETLRQYPSFVDFEKITQSEENKTKEEILTEDNDDPESKATKIICELNEIEKFNLLERIQSFDDTKFEYFVKDFMEKLHYGIGQVTQRSNDGGIDVIISQDELGLNKIYLQAKRYKKDNLIGRPEMQKFAGAMDQYATKYGIFITTSDFHGNAIEYVKQIQSSGKTIILLNGKQIVDLMFKHNIGFRLKQSFEVKEIDYSFLENYSENL